MILPRRIAHLLLEERLKLVGEQAVEEVMVEKDGQERRAERIRREGVEPGGYFLFILEIIVYFSSPQRLLSLVSSKFRLSYPSSDTL